MFDGFSGARPSCRRRPFSTSTRPDTFRCNPPVVPIRAVLSGAVRRVRAFACPVCRGLVAFESHRCLNCQAELGFHAPTKTMVATSSGAAVIDGCSWIACNKAADLGCNWLVRMPWPATSAGPRRASHPAVATTVRTVRRRM
ncbi:zinc-ribbon domain-containing protein [Mycobacterium sp.]|uniref:zinc-ribbon domain-containing protein n=1 Tax=Mycobacterium sp. TaxID=1785 RepID=UPI003F98FB67